MQTVTIELDGVSLQVTGNYLRGYETSHEEPGQGDCFEVATVTDSGVDVTDFHDLDEVADLALDAYLEDQAREASDAADRRRNEGRFLGVAA